MAMVLHNARVHVREYRQIVRNLGREELLVGSLPLQAMRHGCGLTTRLLD